MSEHTEPTELVTDEPGSDVDDYAPTSDQGRTGNKAVDGVLDALDRLPGTAINDHAAVYEKAHEQLRGALDA